MDVVHTAIWVSDLDEALTFYCDGIGLRETRRREGEDGVTNCFVGGESETELQFKYDRTERDVDPSGIDHVAISVDNIDEIVEKLVDRFDVEVTRGPITIDDLDLRVAFLTDPEGYGVELVEYFE